MARFLLFLTVVASLLIGATTAGAQDAATGKEASATDPMAAFRTDKGLISITKAAPDATPVSDYTGDLWNRSTAFGDLLGRQKLYDMGITLDVQLTQVLQGVVSGGPADRPGARYWGLLDYGATFDTAKLGLWSGGLFAANAETSFGNSLLGRSGNVSPVNYLSTLPEVGTPATFLMEYYYTQALPAGASLILGRLNATNFLDKNRFANDPRNQFLNLSMDNDPLFGAFVSFSTYAAFADIPVTKFFHIQPAVWDPNIQPGDYGSTFFKNVGTGAQAELSWTLGDTLGGVLRPVALWTSKPTTDISNPKLPLDILTGQPVAKKDGNYMVHLNFEQYLWKPDVPADASKPARTAVYDFQERGLGVFTRFGWAPEGRNSFTIYLSGGVGGRGVFNSRPYDRFGLGVYWLKASSDLEANVRGLLRDEVGFEAFYNVALTPWLTLAGDLQWIKSAITRNGDAVVLGLRLGTVF
jgi:porin